MPKKIAALTSHNIIRNQGLLARYGGEEFACIFTGKSKDEVFKIANSIRTEILGLQIPNINSSVEPFVTVSIGITTIIPSSDTSCKCIIEAADKQLYIAKKSGRNNISMI